MSVLSAQDAPPPGREGSSGQRVVCYYSTWPYYRQGDGQFLVEDIDAGLCTHVIYSFVLLDNETHLIKFSDAWLDKDLGNMRNFTALKATNPGVKFMVALGGWTDSRKEGEFSW